ncbi:S41 family peptidase [Flavobacterium sp. CS20]|uniref:S41 family peptidase n=1 Tax=Flavobacterium sp. CS20 TaxID=2775246 RepID=UPI001B39E275|nr:S41 family peptidase [Flavobacterium sp. CS20]QTY26942.1 S41 family peptidase [Flavobacterium sp. CS20]
MKTIKKLKYILLTAVAAIILSSYTVYRSDFFEIAKQIEIFTALFKEINMNYVDEVNPAELMNTAITKMLADLDPYTNFYNEQDVEDARIQKSANYANLGIQLKKIENKVVVTELIKDFVADQAGLKLGDQILKIENSPISNLQNDLSEVLNGAPNTTINLEIKRQNETKTISLKRILSQPSAVPFYGMADDKTGFIVLSQFTRTASKDVGLAVLELKEKGAKQLILDLRNNPGGLLSEAVNVSNIFVPKDQLIVYTKSQIESYNATYATRREPIDTEIPLVVLINDRSASASEIVSGSLQDLDRAVIVGARSFGKGLVQRPKPLKYGTQVKITISRYFLPSGRGIQALDYENGKSIRKSIENSTAFQTQNGRTVYDGGGIKPDVKIEAEQISDFTQTLIDDLVIFDFSTQFANQNPDLDWKKFEVDNTIFNQFLDYVKDRKYLPKTETDETFETFVKSAKADNFDEKFIKTLNNLKSEIQAEKADLFKTYQSQISALISDQIIKHYAYNQGVYQHNLDQAEVVQKAVEILSNQNKYKTILKP